MEKKLKSRLPKYVEIIIIGIELVCLLWTCGLFFQEKKVYSFPYQEMDPGAAIEIKDFMGMPGYYIDNGMENWDTMISTPEIELPRGTYQISINYKTDGNGQYYNVTNEIPDYRIITGRTEVGLDSNKSTESFTIWVNEAVEGFRIELGYGGNGYLLVNGISMKETNAWKRIQLFCIGILFLLVDLGYILYRKGAFTRITASKRKIYFGLFVIFMIASYPIFSRYLYDGHDLQFHLLRIQGLKEGILAGQFPVKIQPGWLNRYGYGVSVFYGDMFLYLPAFLALVGFPIQTAYQIYMLAVNAVTCLLAYCCFKKIFKSDGIGLLASMLYTLAPYRLTCLFVRGAVGEYTALAFLPLIFYGLFVIFTEEEENCHKGIIAAVIGYSGLIQTHILSCEMTGFITIVFCVVLWRRVIRPKRFLALAKVVIYTAAVNLWFLVPFLDYMQGSYSVTEQTYGNIQTYGLTLGQLFSFSPQGFGDGFSMSERLAQLEIMPLAIGSAFAAGAVLFIFYCFDKHGKNTWERKTGEICLVISAFLLWMTTVWFPWGRLEKINGTLKFFIQKLQFPWRLLGGGTILLTIVCCCLIKLCRKEEKRRAEAMSCFLGLLAVLTGGWLLSSMVNRNNVIYVPDESKLNTFFIISGEYVPSGTVVSALGNAVPVPSGNISMTSYDKAYTNVWIGCENNSAEEGIIDIPLLYYKGYTAQDEGTKEKLEVGAGENNRVSVKIPAEYRGSIRVKFTEPWYWRAAEIISALFVIGMAVVGVRKKKNLSGRR